MNFNDLFEAPFLGNLFGKNTKPLTTGDYQSRAQMIAQRYKDRDQYGQITHALRNFAMRVEQYHMIVGTEDQKAQQAAFNKIKTSLRELADLNIASSDVRFLSSPQTEEIYKQIRQQQRQGPDQERQASQVRAGLQTGQVQRAQAELDALSEPVDNKQPPKSSEGLPAGVKIYPDSIPLSDETIKMVNQSGFIRNIEDGLYDDVSVLGLTLFGIIVEKGWMKIFPKSFNALNNVTESAYKVAERWIDKERQPNTYEHIDVHGVELFIPKQEYLNGLATRAIADVAQRFPEVAKYTTDVVQKESVNEAVGTHDKLVATVANYMYVKYPEIFTQHGDGYVMTVVDDVVSKWEQQKEPMQDIKAYALEVMDALGVDRTNENRAQIKTDYKGHHLVNADGEKVASYSKDADGLKKARNTLYINHKGLNTMKQEGLNEAFEAALEKLSLNESVTVNTTTSSEGQDTVTVTATDEDAYELVALLKAAGLPHKADEVQSQIVATPCGMESVEEEFANEPTDDIMNGDMDHMNTQSGGLNRQKQQYKPAARGDNPMAVNEENLLRGLWDLYKEAK